MSDTKQQVEFLSELSSEFREHWDTLYEASPWANPFCSIDWLETSYSLLVPSGHCLVPVLIRDGAGMVIAAGIFDQFCDTCQKVKPRMLKLLDYNIQRIPLLLAANEDDLISAWSLFVRAARKRYDRIDMFKLDLLEGSQFKAAYSLSRSRIPYISSVFNTQPAVVLPEVPEGQSVVAAIRSGKTKKKIRWTMRKLTEERGPWYIEDIDSRSEQFPKAFEDMKSVYRSSWQYEDSKRIDSERPEKFLSFIESYTGKSSEAKAHDNDSVRIRTLYCKESPIAFDFILADGMRLYLVFGSFLPDYKIYGPGTILLADMIENEPSGSILEMGGGYMDYKLPWANTCFNTMHLSIFGSSPKGRLIAAKHMLEQTLQGWDNPLQRWQRLRRKVKGKTHRRLGVPKREPEVLEYILELPLIPEKRVKASSDMIKTVAITEAHCEELSSVREVDDPAVLASLFRNRLAQGAHATALMRGDEFLAYTWTIIGRSLVEDADNTQFALSDSQVYIFDTYISSKARGQDLFPLLMSSVQQEYLPGGQHQSIVIIDQDNVSSLRAHMKIGAAIVGSISYRYRRWELERSLRIVGRVCKLASRLDAREPTVCSLAPLIDEY